MIAAALIFPVLLAIQLGRSTISAEDPSVAIASFEEPATAPTSPLISPDPVQVSGNTIYRWQIGDADASLLEGDCLLQHDGRRIAAESILLVTDGNAGNVNCRLVLGGAILPEGKSNDPISLSIRTLIDPQIQAPVYRGKPNRPPSLLQYLPNQTSSDVAQADGGASGNVATTIQQAQFTDSLIPPPQAGSEPITFSDGATTKGMQFIVGGGTRSMQILARGASTPPDFETINRPESNESAFVFRGGVTVLIRDVSARLPNGEFMELGTISLSADRIVGWFPYVPNLLNGMSNISDSEGEMYLEGDIVFRQGERIIYAESMYFNAAREVGMILDAEAITTVPNYQGVVRLKSKVLQQINRGNFRAFDAAVTTSRIGVPRYWIQSEELKLTDRQRLEVDPATGIQRTVRDPTIESNNNFVYVAGVPVLYWPTFSASLDQPGYYITGASVGNDSNFGTRVELDFDLFQLFGIDNVPKGVEWELSTDYLSDRGPAIGTSLDYTLPGLMGVAGPAKGMFDAWGIYDTGLDNLGSDRRNLTPESTTRGRALLRHRHYLPNDYEFIAELGYLSDRNFLEQYLENEWDQDLDHRTALRFRKYYYNNLIDLSANAQVNDFYTETEDLPKLDHYLLGGSLLGDRLTYSAHNAVSYSRLNVADLPTDAAEAAQYSAIPGETQSQGVVATTRQGIALPVQLGPVKIVPNLMGEATHYGEAVDGDSLTRLVGQAGIRFSLPMWNVDPSVQSSLLNVRGLAHKLEWTAEYLYADSDTNLDEVPYYDPLDDNAQEQFRRRFIQDTYGGILPDQFDPRNYAFRQGFQGLIASPSDVVADDLQQLRFGLHQRWQTKRGLPGAERIVDLFQFDVDTMIFPDADRDNFGQTIGPTLYDMRYHVGDRVTLLSDGYFDFFDEGLRSISGGVRTSRPGVGDIYVGLLSIEGPISSTVLRSTLDYRLNEKWIASAGTTYDFGPTGNVGQSLGVTRIGESMLLRLGVNVDAGRDNVGFRFAIEPRFWPRPKLGRLGGQLIPPPGVEGLE
ncbi:LPS-assembly protein LptD [Rubripirellula reticaptiva]|uniref:organic solvent tolerance protein OstA n=1 Tax=Rubripirellula reticaptiva TaxID=2528013 RepID=UPI0011B68311|nr:organic solvent tolerance protein OstA [Rubripirellula reticaptiva]